MNHNCAEILSSLLNNFNDLARKFIEAKKYREAIDIYETLSKGDSEYDDGFNAYQIAKCYDSLNERGNAKKFYAIAYNANPSVPEYDFEYKRTRLI